MKFSADFNRSLVIYAKKKSHNIPNIEIPSRNPSRMAFNEADSIYGDIFDKISSMSAAFLSLNEPTWKMQSICGSAFDKYFIKHSMGKSLKGDDLNMRDILVHPL